MKSLPARIANKIEIADNGCWLWLGWTEKKENGKLDYGKVWWNGTMRYAHRIVYTLIVGEIPVGTELDHLCRTPSCVNPAHLEPVTPLENVKRRRPAQITLKCECGECKTCRDREAMRRYRARKRQSEISVS